MSVIQELRGLLRLRVLQLAGLAAFLTWAGGRAISLKYCVLDLDLYWHLGVGDWILQHHAVPRTGILSYSTASLPWTAYSWGYEVLLSLAYKEFQLIGIALFGVLLTLLVAGCVYWMLHRLSGRFWLACALAAVACWAFLFSLMPRPVFFSMVLFMVTLTLILEAQRTGRIQTLYWLPLVFVLWANLHIQFIYGLFLVGLLLGISLLQRLAGSLGVRPDFLSPPIAPAQATGGRILRLSAGDLHWAVLISPLRSDLRVLTGQTSLYDDQRAAAAQFSIHRALPAASADGCRFFRDRVAEKDRSIQARALDRRQHRLLSHHARRLVHLYLCCRLHCRYFVCNPSQEETGRAPGRTVAEMAGVALVCLVLLLLIASNSDFNTRGLDELISSQFPVAAVNFLRQNPPPGPLYNNLDWGGFLIWYMPGYPVAIDGRNDLYGDDLDRIFISSQMGDKSYETDPYLNQAGVVLLRRDLPLVNLLRNDPRFRLVYEDQSAAVFVRG